MAGEVTVDALPYIDQGYDDAGVRESALAMVEEECRRYRPTKNYLDHLPPLNANAFETELMASEFERIQNRQPMETLSMKRYELPPPPSGKLSEVSAWQESIENSMAQLEHQWVRAMNLELMLDYGIESWKAYLEVIAALQAKTLTQLQESKKQIQDINWQRKQAQTHAGEKLKSLEANWVLLVSKNYEIEQKCAELEDQLQKALMKIESLKARKSTTLTNGDT
ncbi:pre-mRNA-splicing factor SPF27 [Bactrocera dorsalis]|uniref:Pre-mRNA-splicing factor SPF27 n=1 Tax=Bactrocera dorsalis TaxID=27457 RepID=A0A034VG38_BACDO|nr:pre-mRNA-splicing factor SPF27 [Bactrocera dorsalis]